MHPQQPYPQAPYPGVPQQPMPQAVYPSAAPPAAAIPGKGLANATVGLLGICAAFPLVAWLLMRLLPASVYEVGGSIIDGILSGFEFLLFLTAFIVFLVWLYKTVAGLRAAGATTRYSPGMSVGSWFIPFANFVLPLLAVKDTMRVVTGGQRGGGLVVGWWLLWLGSAVLGGAYSGLTSGGIFDPDLFWIFTAVFWLKTLAQVTAFGLWALVVRTIAGAQTSSAQPVATPQYAYGQ